MSDRNGLVPLTFTAHTDPLVGFGSSIEAAYTNWQMRTFFTGSQWRPDGTAGPARTSARNHLIGRGFSEVEVDEFLAQQAACVIRLRGERAEREAYERTRRYRVRAWLNIRRDRIALAAEVLRGEHECGGDQW